MRFLCWTEIVLDAEVDLKRADLKPEAAAFIQSLRLRDFRKTEKAAVERAAAFLFAARHRELDVVDGGGGHYVVTSPAILSRRSRGARSATGEGRSKDPLVGNPDRVVAFKEARDVTNHRPVRVSNRGVLRPSSGTAPSATCLRRLRMTVMPARCRTSDRGENIGRLRCRRRRRSRSVSSRRGRSRRARSTPRGS